jgi:hypothetical protein
LTSARDILGEIEARLEVRRERRRDDALFAQDRGVGEDVLVGRRRLEPGFLQQVLTVVQVLGVDHEGDCHDVVADLDQLRRLQVLAVFRDQVVERPDQALTPGLPSLTASKKGESEAIKRRARFCNW